MKERKYTNLPFFMIWYLFISVILTGANVSNATVFRYADEILCVIMAAILFATIIKKGFAEPDSSAIFLFLVTVFAIGLVSNIAYGIQRSRLAIALDIVSNFKLLVIYLAFYHLTEQSCCDSITRSLQIPSRVLIVCGFLFGLISRIVDVGMLSGYRFGIRVYRFIFQYAHIYTMLVIFCIIIIVLGEQNQRRSLRYLIMAAIQVMMTLKGPSLIWAIVTPILLLYYQSHRRLSIATLIPIGIISVFVGQYQIQGYLLNPNAPRALFYKYGALTAFHYFPIGSGFATFGSDMAAKYYSPLYYGYGFDSRYGMNPFDTSFMNDNYWPMLLGQFGIIGMILMLYAYVRLFLSIERKEMPALIKAIVVSAYLYMMLFSLGSSSSLTSIEGILLSTGIAVALKAQEVRQAADTGSCTEHPRVGRRRVRFVFGRRLLCAFEI